MRRVKSSKAYEAILRASKKAKNPLLRLTNEEIKEGLCNYRAGKNSSLAVYNINGV